MVAILLLIIGAFLGSFFGVLADRLSTNRQIIRGRSYCESCKHTLSTLDLIPLFSFLYLKGKCRYCHKKIPSKLFLIELITAISFGLLYLYYQSNNLTIEQFIFYLIITSCFIVIMFSDLYYGIIPDELTIAIAIVSLIYHSSNNPFGIVPYLLSGIGAFLFFIMLFLFTKARGMGFGDVKLSFSLGLLLGYPGIIIGLYAAFLTGACISLILILLGIKRLKGDTIPFGPFLILGAIIVLLFNAKITDIITRYLFNI